MIRLSAGTAMELGMTNGSSDIPPTTAYIMIGNKCNNNCSFCSQSIDSSTRKDKLARVLWPEYSLQEIINNLKSYDKQNIKRICLQAMANDEALEIAKKFILKAKENLEIPISLSAKVENEKDIDRFLNLGVDKIGIAIDAANKELYESIKGNNFKEKLKFIIDMGKKYPGKISTHIIVGMGETHEDIYDLYTFLIDNNITVSLFAFTPVRGTKMEKVEQPNIESYRRVQLMTYLIQRGYNKNSFNFDNGYLENIKDIELNIIEDIKNGLPFEIRGCKDCNRPYYNERPGKTIYNYSRKLTEEEIERAIEEIGLNIDGVTLCKYGE